jgi:putative membrane fusion protein
MPRPRRNTKRNTLRKKTKGQIIRKKILIILLLVLAAGIMYHPIKNLAVSKLIQYGTAQWKVLEQSVVGEGVIIRDETIIPAPVGGVFEPLVSEGEKVAAGRIIGYIKTQGATEEGELTKVPVQAPKAGLVSFHPDGLEEVLKPNLLGDLDWDKVSALFQENRAPVAGFPKAEKGKPICKIVDNLLNPYLFIQCPQDTLAGVEKGQEMKVRLSDKVATKTIIHEVKKSKEHNILLAEVFDAPDSDLESRFVPVQVISHVYEGVTILKEALVRINGEEGIYVPRKGICKWVKVEVKGCVGEEAVVSGLDAGTEYIINSSLVCQGQRL